MSQKEKEKIKDLRAYWKTWADKKCYGLEDNSFKGFNLSYLRIKIQKFAAVMCIAAIKKISKK